MFTQQKIEIAKKEQDLEIPGEKGDAELYVLTVGATKLVWAFTTVHKEEIVEIIPVFDNEDLVLAMLAKLKEKAFQAGRVSLPRLQVMAEKGPFLFIHNPETITRSNEVLLKEGANWYLSFEQLTKLLSPKVKKSSRK